MQVALIPPRRLRPLCPRSRVIRPFPPQLPLFFMDEVALPTACYRMDLSPRTSTATNVLAYWTHNNRCTGWFSFNPTENLLYDPECDVGECSTCDHNCMYQEATNDTFLFDLTNDPYERVRVKIPVSRFAVYRVLRDVRLTCGACPESPETRFFKSHFSCNATISKTFCFFGRGGGGDSCSSQTSRGIEHAAIALR